MNFIGHLLSKLLFHLLYICGRPIVNTSLGSSPLK
nr:MAG TPA: hypothetical protein [Caudoviricetes sp.]